MGRKVLHALAAAALLAAYLMASLHPFHPLRWEFPRAVANGAELLPQGGVRFPEPGIVRSSSPPDWLAAAMRPHRLELSLRVRSFAPDQDGPARIFTLSADTSRRNLTLGQDGEDLVLRLRTPATGPNGVFADGAPVARVPDVFRTAAWIDLRVSIEPGRLRVEIGHETRVDEELPPEPLRDWNASHRLALGNELTNDRPWLGEVGRAVVSTGRRATDYAEAGVLEVPPRLWYAVGPLTLEPFAEGDLRDAAVNLAGYVPLGFLFGLWGRGRARGWRTLALVAAPGIVSAGMEVLQFAVPDRHPSATDLLLNTLGGGIGVLLALSTKRPIPNPA